MNRLIITLIFALFFFNIDVKAQCNEQLVNQCALSVGDNATYLKEFKCKLPKKRRRKPTPVARFTVVLSKGSQYRFTLCKAEDYEGVPILELYDTNRKFGGTYNIATGKHFKSFDFICTKTGVYQVFMQFMDGKEGCAVGIMSLVK